MKGYIGLIFVMIVALLVIGMIVGAITFPQALEFMLGLLSWAFWIIVAILAFVLAVVVFVIAIVFIGDR